MPTPVFIGEFEQLVLLAVLRAGGGAGGAGGATALEIRQRLAEVLDRPVSRGALYRTLDRVEQKGWVVWALDDEDVPERGGYPRRRFRVTPQGIQALAASRAALLELWSGLEEVLG
jgi:PadR family transcriptional regulator, regulatory protein PadR